MELIRGFLNVRKHHRGCIASIGNYDGVHRGHQAIVRQLLRKRDAFALPALIITFEPHPLEYFRGGDQTRISSLRAKIKLLAEYGIERMLCLRFNESLANMSAESFMQDLLMDGLGVKHLVVGDDFRFGKSRSGNFEVLREFGEHHGFSVENTDTFMVNGERVSSTRIRQALELGQLDLAELLLGRPYSISGRVAHGDKLGRTWGFPTANINLQHQNPPLNGIYVVEVEGLDAAPVPGVAYVGTRPTVDGTRRVLEIHLIGFHRNIYGERIVVYFLEKLRADEKFDERGALIAQIAKDKLDAELFFKRRP
ncbi:bifunctional riboflavin kinase/FAD synthetase [Gammaproteobacteria bacterium]|nr:bifunctional riboflavin kinase/FAD synthetase [Gammaproteobacteria bacterium]